ncbi:MAG: hypothetical protein P8K08_00995 [Fuerstiella sp.]|nr:hypothetical protein [Fuerstiella sp.]
MLESQEPNDTTRRTAALCLIMVFMSGCVSRLPGARSSLSTRTAKTDHEGASTVRSQNGRQTGDWTVPLLTPNAPGGHFGLSTSTGTSNPPGPSVDNAPAARLLTPNFGGQNEHQIPPPDPLRNSVGITQNEPHQLDAASTETAGAHIIESAAAQLRSIINRQSQNEMSEGTVLSDRTATWQVLSRSDQAALRDTKTATVAATAGPADEIVTPPITAHAATFGGQTPPMTATEIVPESATESATETETGQDSVPPGSVTDPSVFDRLRGLYDSSGESGPRQSWKEQFRKLQPSWSPFRERGEPTLLLPPESLQDQAPKVTAHAENPSTHVSPLLLQLITETTAELQNWPGVEQGTPENLHQFRRRHQDLRLLQLVANEPGEAVAAIDTMTPAEQDFWQELMLGLAQYRSVTDQADQELALTNAAGQLTSAVRRLSPLAALRCRRLDICSRIFSFGRIETFPSNDFEAGQPILLYAELENFTTETTPAGNRRTRFDAQLQILHDDDSADPIETINLANITDEASSERSDYYQSFELTVPSHLARGTYRIRVRLRDRISGKAATETVSFQVR